HPQEDARTGSPRDSPSFEAFSRALPQVESRHVINETTSTPHAHRTMRVEPNFGSYLSAVRSWTQRGSSPGSIRSWSNPTSCASSHPCSTLTISRNPSSSNPCHPLRQFPLFGRGVDLTVQPRL